ncbi:hypothetical protein ScPMuIL_002359 [Solemya velum]
MKTGFLVLIFICAAVYFNLVFANKCADMRDRCLLGCTKAQNPGLCKKNCRASYDRCMKFEKNKKGRKRQRKKNKNSGRQWSNPKRALISLGLETIQAAIRRFTFNPKISRMGTN